MIAEYPGFEVDFILWNKPEAGDNLDLCNAEFFDITGPEYPFKGISVGMPQPNASDLPDGFNIFDTAVLAEAKNLPMTTLEVWQIILAEHILTNFRPIDYYADYDHFLYMECWDEIHDDPDWMRNPYIALGAVILFKDGRVARIAFGLPMAD